VRIAYSYRARMPIPRLTGPVLRRFGKGVDRKLPADSAHLRQIDIGEWGGLLCPKRRVSRFFCALRCPRLNRRTLARGQGAGGLECTWRRRAWWLESKADMQKRGQASPDDGDALALTFAQPVAPAEVEEPDEEEEFGSYGGHSSSGGGGWMR
jgi:hypothetical protein